MKEVVPLNRAIDSVLCQSYKEIEKIVVDDNDPTSDERKNTEALMSRYIGDKRIRYIKHQRNSNGAVARNTGITAATGKYIAFLDDDDYYLPNRIEKSVRYLEKNRDAVGVYAGVDIIDKEGNINLKVRPQCDLKISDLLRKEMVIGTGSNIFVKSDVVKGIHGFDESFVRRQDIEFMIRVCHEGRVGYIPDKLIVKSENGTLKVLLQSFNTEYKSPILIL
ncbi:glycosyltransferase [Streptococcus thermophilus]|nr:glycosyltransferase [Streptococcus thermophilus]